MVTGHGLTGSYLHRFKIIPNLTCPSGIKEEQNLEKIDICRCQGDQPYAPTTFTDRADDRTAIVRPEVF